MRIFAAPALALLTLALLARYSQAQFIYPPFEVAFSDSLTMLQDASVCKELKLGDDEIAKVDDALAPARKYYKDESARLQNAPIADAGRQYGDLFRKTGEAAWKALDAALAPDQMKRFRQLVLQRQGPGLFESEDVQKRLSLTDDQKSQVKKLADECKRKSDQAAVGPEGRAKLKAELTRDTLALLSDEQRKIWDDLTGAPFELKRGWMRDIRKVKDN